VGERTSENGGLYLVLCDIYAFYLESRGHARSPACHEIILRGIVAFFKGIDFYVGANGRGRSGKKKS
jgi:hypothetical protein